jgi:predicted PolB exonuclease-like 3'-5' exonuclease
MLREIDIRNVLFLDIETVPQSALYKNLPEKTRELWEKKSSYFRKEGQDAESVYEKAGIYAEFGKIICISVGLITKELKPLGIRIHSYAGDDEKKILLDFTSMLEKYRARKEIYLCAHNGKEFDFPYIARRMLINGLKLSGMLDSAGKKPWEIKHLDTLELWKFGDYKHYTSLDLLTNIFTIPSPKNDMDGSMVADVYWNQGDLKRISEYCQNDVLAIAQLLLRYKGMELIPVENVEIVE